MRHAQHLPAPYSAPHPILFRQSHYEIYRAFLDNPERYLAKAMKHDRA
jgi:hypothetical protein